jgi:hypothetical protein
MRPQPSFSFLLCAGALASSLGACAPAQRYAAPAPASHPTISASQPRLVVEELEHWAPGFDAAYAVALRNLHQPNSFHRTRHARAAPAIRGVHLWDSAFLSHIWKAWDVRIAQEINLAVLDQAKDGRIPHFSHRLLRSDLTQPPVIAWSIWENFLWSADTAYLATAFPVLEAYDAWLYEHRRLASGLFFWRAAFESGKDNSPRFDSPGRRGQRDLRSVAAVDLSSYVVLQSSVLARMAEVLGQPERRRFHETNADTLRSLINSHLWDEETGYYYDRDEQSGELLKVRTAASFLPLFASVPDSARARRLRDHAMDPASFNSTIPLPTVALDDPSFSNDMWRGPVWINVSYMIIRGLEAYGFHEDAAQLAFATVDGVFRTYANTAGVWEFYDAERFDIARLERKRGELLKRVALGSKPLPHYGWSALVNTLLVEYLVGYRRQGEQRWIVPRLPAVAAGVRMQLTLPDERVVIRVEVREDGLVQGEVDVDAHREEFLLASGQSVSLPVSSLLGAAQPLRSVSP